MSDRPAIPFEDALARLPDGEEMLATYRESVAKYRRIKELREALARARAEVAGRKGIDRSALSEMARGADAYVDVLREAVEVMGGRLDVVVRLPDQPPARLGRFGTKG